jgi:beta-glucosidase
MRESFPDDFWWGTSASSPESEGAAPASDWWQWERAGKVPPSGDGNGFASRYAEDFRLYKAFGLTHHRLGIEWARIEPEPGRRDAAAVDHYRDMLATAGQAGIYPWVCLHHFVLPRWVAAGGMGFCDSRAREYYWRRHVEFIAETFGDLVFGWQPVNEPNVYAANGFLSGVNPPGITDWDVAMAAMEGAYVASAIAAEVLSSTGRPIATIQALYPFIPADGSAAAADVVERLDAATWGCWVTALRDGVLAVPGRSALEVPAFAHAFDYVGFSYYSALCVTEELTTVPYPAGARVGPMGYAPWSEGLGLVLDRLHAELPGRPLLVAEHGVGTDDDEWRCDELRRSLAVLAERIAAGVDVRGFFHWTGVDNYEWAFGYDVHFGLFDRDRRPKPSARLLAQVAVEQTVPA